jgi:signal transduction histidine kinase/ligand-binding sensor domain-containing protein
MGGTSRGALHGSIVAFALAFGGGADALALDPGKRLDEFVARVFTGDDGVHSSVLALAQTPDGFLWVGTAMGVFRFDGVAFTPFALDGVRPASGFRTPVLAVGPEGSLWGASEVVPLARLVAGRFVPVEIPGRPRVAPIHARVDRAGALWLGTWTGVVRYGLGQVRRFTEDELPIRTVEAVAEDRQGRLWIGGNRGIGVLSGDRFESWHLPDGAPFAHRVQSLLFDRQGALWVGTNRAGLFRVHDRKVTAWGPEDAGEWIRTLLEDRDGVLWIGSSVGLLRLHGGRLETEGELNRLIEQPVNALTEDREGNLWAGTQGGALLRLSDGPGVLLARGHGVPAGRVKSVAEAIGGGLWLIVTEAGLVHLGTDGAATLGPLAVTDQPPGTLDLVLQTLDGTVWVTGPSEGRISLWRMGRDGTRRFEIPAVTMASAPDGALYIGANQVQRYDRARDAFVPLGPPGSRPRRINALASDGEGGLWVGDSRGLSRWSEGRWRHYGKRDGYTGGQVLSLALDGGTVWIGTTEGLWRLHEGRAQALTGEDALATAVVSIAVDRHDHLWACTPMGIHRLPRPPPGRTRLSGARAVTAGDGVPAPSCRRGQLYGKLLIAGNGRVLIPTSHGLAVIDPARMSASPPLTAVVDTVTVDGRRLEGSQGVAAPGDGNLEIAFTAPSLRAPESLRFRYRLHPRDDGWVDAGSGRRAVYTKLAPDRYRFELQAHRGDGRWSAPAVASFSLAPRYYQTSAFKAAMGTAAAMALLLVLWTIHRARVRTLAVAHQARADERLRIARDLHDTLAQGFTGMAIMIDNVSSMIPSPSGQIAAALEKMRRLSDESLEEARRAVWDLRHAGEADLVTLLADMARRMSVEAPVDVRVAGSVRAVPRARKAALLGIAREAVTNALRHAQASAVVVELAFSEDEVSLTVRDDGRGTPEEVAGGRPGHFGVVGMRERAERAGGVFRLKSGPGAGTTVTVVLPLRERR